MVNEGTKAAGSRSSLGLSQFYLIIYNLVSAIGYLTRKKSKSK